MTAKWVFARNASTSVLGITDGGTMTVYDFMLMVGKDKRFCVSMEGVAPSEVFTLRTIDYELGDKEAADRILEKPIEYIDLRHSEDVFKIIVEG